MFKVSRLSIVSARPVSHSKIASHRCAWRVIWYEGDKDDMYVDESHKIS